jgi:hypothetical protein
MMSFVSISVPTLTTRAMDSLALVTTIISGVAGKLNVLLLKRNKMLTTHTSSLAVAHKYLYGGKPLNVGQFNRLPLIERLLADDVVEGHVHSPIYKSDGSNSYVLVVRGEYLLKMRCNGPTTDRIPYGSMTDAAFEAQYGMSKSSHKMGFWQWVDKVEARELRTFTLGN